MRKLQGLLAAWCEGNINGLTALKSFLEHGAKSRKPDASKRTRRRPAKDGRKDRTETEAKQHAGGHEEELEQGEIPSASRPRHAVKHRNVSRRTPRPFRTMSPRKGRQRSRTPTRRMSGQLPVRVFRHPVRNPMRPGTMRMDDASPRERVKNASVNRVRR